MGFLDELLGGLAGQSMGGRRMQQQQPMQAGGGGMSQVLLALSVNSESVRKRGMNLRLELLLLLLG